MPKGTPPNFLQNLVMCWNNPNLSQDFLQPVFTDLSKWDAVVDGAGDLLTIFIHRKLSDNAGTSRKYGPEVLHKQLIIQLLIYIVITEHLHEL